MYSVLCVFISQYSIKFDFILIGEAEMEPCKDKLRCMQFVHDDFKF